MTLSGWLQVALFCAIVLALVKPLGLYMTRVFTGARTPLSPLLRPVERGLYRLAGLDEAHEQHWLAYAGAMLVFHAAGFVLLYCLLRLQAFLPLNPAGQAAMAPDLAFNTAVSFVTNTNWQNYGGESTLSYLSQMLGLTPQNFLSAATGPAPARSPTGPPSSPATSSWRSPASRSSAPARSGRRSCSAAWRWRPEDPFERRQPIPLATSS